jgi:hypothetical protein
MANGTAHNTASPSATNAFDNAMVRLPRSERTICNQLPTRGTQKTVNQNFLKRVNYGANSFVTIPLREIWSIGRFFAVSEV